ncbi:RNA polymerase sigma factor [Sphingobacterium spiritivorum]|uniref:RNA polymerase sigma factor n=1 Tax=Sphingobacterium spiritivorum TaxID=258 RepID=A0A380BNA7_SPHSI|nr:RNA polymerase sigma-70 factor [Sphingobacterium spiritivorum]SUJ03635.1 RNA polymerase sigma factor [Sphingobacterium spiritivorum]
MNISTEHTYLPLLAKIANHDQHAFSELYDMFYPSLSRHILQKVDDSTVAEDLLHDLFLSLWKNRENLLKIESLPAYLYSSCRYLVIAYYQKKTAVEYYDDLSDYYLLLEEQPLEERLHYRYVLDIVEQEIENLPEKCKQIFKLSREEFKTNKEIAKDFDISESTVENHINKAIKRLKSVTRHFFHFFL